MENQKSFPLKIEGEVFVKLKQFFKMVLKKKIKILFVALVFSALLNAVLVVCISIQAHRFGNLLKIVFSQHRRMDSFISMLNRHQKIIEEQHIILSRRADFSEKKYSFNKSNK